MPEQGEPRDITPEITEQFAKLAKAFVPVGEAITKAATEIGASLAKATASWREAGWLDSCTRPDCGHIRFGHLPSGCAHSFDKPDDRCACPAFLPPEPKVAA